MGGVPCFGKSFCPLQTTLFFVFFLIFGFGQEVPFIGACVDGNWTIVGKTISLADSSACKVEWGRILINER